MYFFKNIKISKRPPLIDRNYNNKIERDYIRTQQIKEERERTKQPPVHTVSDNNKNNNGNAGITPKQILIQMKKTNRAKTKIIIFNSILIIILCGIVFQIIRNNTSKSGTMFEFETTSNVINFKKKMYTLFGGMNVTNSFNTSSPNNTNNNRLFINKSNFNSKDNTENRNSRNYSSIPIINNFNNKNNKIVFSSSKFLNNNLFSPQPRTNVQQINNNSNKTNNNIHNEFKQEEEEEGNSIGDKTTTTTITTAKIVEQEQTNCENNNIEEKENYNSNCRGNAGYNPQLLFLKNIKIKYNEGFDILMLLSIAYGHGIINKITFKKYILEFIGSENGANELIDRLDDSNVKIPDIPSNFNLDSLFLKANQLIALKKTKQQ